jgi:hypothetical protein
MESQSPGFTNTAQPPVTSGNDVVLDVIAAVPQAIASSGGNPNPSYKDG